MKTLLWRPQALRDAEEAASWYAEQGGLPLELGFIDELQAVLERLSRHPASGSARHASLFPELPGTLRFQVLDRFDLYLVYYLDLPGHIEIVRIWNAARGLAALLQGEQEPDQENDNV